MFKIFTLLKNSDLECNIRVKNKDIIIKDENRLLKINPSVKGNNKNFSIVKKYVQAI